MATAYKIQTNENEQKELFYEENPFFKVKYHKSSNQWYVVKRDPTTGKTVASTKVPGRTPFYELRDYLWRDTHYEDLEAVHDYFQEKYGRKRRVKQEPQPEEHLLKNKMEDYKTIIENLEQANKELTQEYADLLNKTLSLERKKEELTNKNNQLKKDAKRMRRLDKILSNNNNGPTYLNRKNKHLGKKSNEGYFAHDTNFSKFKSPKYYVELKADEVKFFRRCDEFINGYNGNFKGHWR